MGDVVIGEVAKGRAGGQVQPDLGWVLAGFSVIAGALNLATVPVYADSWALSIGLAAVGWFQLGVPMFVLLGAAPRRAIGAACVGNLVFLAAGAWAVSSGSAPPAHSEAALALSAVMALGVVLVGARLLLTLGRRSVGWPVIGLSVGASLAVATAVLVSNRTVADVASVGRSSTRNALIDRHRCDQGLNPPAYWTEASAAGVDTHGGGHTAANASVAQGPEHGSDLGDAAVSVTPRTDPYHGRGSPGLDRLVSLTGLAATSEVESANLVNALSHATQEDYDAWLWWLKSSGTIGSQHALAASGEDGTGHGGHVGPQPWTAVTDQRECDALAQELEVARTTALKFPTVEAATRAGFELVGSYQSGIGAHFIRWELVDRSFALDQPEMLLFDGTSPSSKIIGLSYYVLNPGEIPSTQGFIGTNDRGHRHLIDGPDSGWMTHAWVVPGCENPWGVFSAVNPLLDDALALAGEDGSGGPGCVASRGRDRYGLNQASRPRR